MTTMLEAALAYAGRGWKIFPLHSVDDQGHCTCGKPDVGGSHGKEGRSRGKHPRTPDGSKSASCDLDVVRKWWTQWPDANIGFVSGPYADCFQLDVDGDHRGHESLDLLQERYEALPGTAVARTGGGLHVYFGYTWSDGAVELRPRNGSLYDLDGTPLPGLDLRGGGNGYVLLPPSRHFSGATYTWQGGTQEIAECPDWLWKVITQGKPAPKAPAPRTGTTGTRPVPQSQMAAYLEKALAGAAEDIRQAGRGSGAHETIYDRAHRFGGYIGDGCDGYADEALITATLIEAGLSTGKDEREVRNAVTQGIAVGKTKPCRPALQARVEKAEVLAYVESHPEQSSRQVADLFGMDDSLLRRWLRTAKTAVPTPVNEPGGDDSYWSDSGPQGEGTSVPTPKTAVPTPGGDEGGDEGGDADDRPHPPATTVPTPPTSGTLQHLAVLAKRIKNENSDRLEPLLRELLDLEFLQELATERVTNPVAGTADLLVIASVRPGGKKVVDEVERAVGKLLRALKVVEDGPASAERITASDLKKGLGRYAEGLDISADLRVPAGWAMDADGVYSVSLDKKGNAVEERICARPIFVAGEAVDVDGGGVTLDVRWRDGRAWRQRWVPRGVALVARALAELAQHGLPVSSASAPDVVRWLESFLACNAAALPKSSTSWSLGWKGDSFLWGSTVIGEASDVQLDASDPGTMQLITGYRQHGTWEGWCDAIRPLVVHPRIMLALAAAAVPPLFHALPEAPNFILEWAGKTSGGKTTALRVAASAWGYPHDQADGLVKMWDATPTSIERTAAFSNFLPLILDDTKRVREKDAGLLQRIVYAVAQGQGRMRGTLTGLQRQVSWRTVLLTTGEERITDVATSGGAAARVLSIWGSPFGRASSEYADLSRATAASLIEHYGHLGPRVVRWMQDAPEGEIRTRYRAAMEHWGRRAGGNAVAERAVAYVSILDVALGILAQLGVPLSPEHDPLAEAWRAVVQATQTADTEVQALHVVYEWAAACEESFYGRHLMASDGTPIQPKTGWCGTWKRDTNWAYIGVLGTKLDEVLERKGFSARTVRQAWKDRGWLRLTSGDKTSIMDRLGSGELAPQVRVVGILRTAMEDIGALEGRQVPLIATGEDW